MAEQHTPGPLTVIVVEDDVTFLSFWRKFLERIGVHDFRLMSDACEARDVIASRGVKLLISDITLNKLNGYELAKIARTFSPACRVILTTAYSANLTRFDLTAFAFHLLPKPYNDLESLAKLILHLIAGDEHFDDLSEDSFSENEDYPMVTEWKI